jgi:hypothetical protein
MVLDSVAFWNYADGPPLDGPGADPRADDLKGANGKLKKVITKLEPNLVILMSRRLWPNLSKGAGFGTDPNALHGTVCKDKGWRRRIQFPEHLPPTRVQQKEGLVRHP